MENSMTGPTAPVGETLNFRIVTHVTSVQSLDIGDVDGHAASLARFSGLAFFPDGTVCAVSFASVSDYTKGAGSFTLYPIVTFEGSSVFWIKSMGTGTIDGEETRIHGAPTDAGSRG